MRGICGTRLWTPEGARSAEPAHLSVRIYDKIKLSRSRLASTHTPQGHVLIIVNHTLPSPAMKGLALAKGLAGKPVGRAIGTAGACKRFARAISQVVASVAERGQF